MMRWSDLFDMLVLILAAPALTQLPLGDVQAAVQRHFARRAAQPPRRLPPPPRVWRSAWYRLVGPITQIAPDINRAGVAAAAFWNPVLSDDGAPVGAHWDVKRWRWASPRDEPFGPRGLRGNVPQGIQTADPTVRDGR